MVKVCKLIWATVCSGPIYSVDIHPDGSRYAFSQNNSCRIMGMENIKFHIAMEKSQVLSSGTKFSQDYMNYLEAELFNITYHENNVNIVRFSKCGKYLALGSDDSSVSIHELTWITKEATPEVEEEPQPDEDGIVWDAAPTSGFEISKEWKAGETKKESWKLKKHLREHSGMVLSFAWSDEVFASSSVDNTVCVYEIESMELTHRLRPGYVVKGLSFDPVRKFLCCEGDGKLESYDLSKNYERSGEIEKQKSLEVMFCRPSYSPDGAIVLGTNTIQGRHHVVPFVLREGFELKSFLRGHRGEVICTSFSPHLYYGSERKQYYTYFMTGSMDKTVCVWANFRDKPILVVQLCYDKITDLAWDRTGYSALCSSADGSLVHLEFTKEELGQTLDRSAFRKYMKQKYGAFGQNRMGLMEYAFKNTTAVKVMTPKQFQNVKELQHKHQEAVGSALLRITGEKRPRTDEMRFEEDEERVAKKLKINEAYVFGERQVRITNRGEVEVLENAGKDHEGRLLWKAYVGRGIDKVVTNNNFTVIATKDKFLHIFSAFGRRISPPILLDDNLRYMKCNSNHSFMILNENLDMFVYDVQQRKKTMECNIAFFSDWGEQKGIVSPKMQKPNPGPPNNPPTAPKGPGEEGEEVVDVIDHVGLTENGVPIIVLKNSMCFMFDVNWKDWVRVSSNTASPFVSGVPELYQKNESEKNVLHSVASVRHMMSNVRFTDMNDKLKKIDDLESSISIARNLNNSQEYMNLLNIYIGVLTSGESHSIFENKIREFFESLIRKGINEEILGIKKLRILENLLSIISGSKKYERLAQEFKSRLELINTPNLDLEDI